MAFMFDSVAIRFRKGLLGEEAPRVVDYKWPKDWWEALKERWAPGWFLKRWPVLFHHETVDLWTCYPDIAIPKQNTVRVPVINSWDDTKWRDE
jgi:hypothetical protein